MLTIDCDSKEHSKRDFIVVRSRAPLIGCRKP